MSRRRLYYKKNEEQEVFVRCVSLTLQKTKNCSSLFMTQKHSKANEDLSELTMEVNKMILGKNS